MRFPPVRPGSAVDEWEPIPISRLSHAAYCLRRAALLTNEQLWAENADTAKGRAEHARTHTARIERRGSQLLLYETSVRSDLLNLSGKCDCIEASEDEGGCMMPGVSFPVRLYPVEYKHGKVRDEEEYEIQLCAQAMCLEEMFQTRIPEGAIFYVSSHRRKKVPITGALRGRVREVVNQLEQIRRSFRIPPAEDGPKCVRCSLRELCMPKLKSSAAAYCEQLREDARKGGKT